MKKHKSKANAPEHIFAPENTPWKSVGIGVFFITFGFIVLTNCAPAGNNWASVLAPFLIISGYITIGASLWRALRDREEEPKAGWLEYSVFLISLSGYTYLLYPSLAPHLSSELSAASGVLGIPHAPGYPLYVLLGKIFISSVPLGNIAYRMNLMSAFFAALSNVFFFKIIFYIFRDKAIAILGTTIFVASHIFLPLVLAADTVSLSVFLVLLMIYACVVSESNNMPLLAFLFALALGNHHTSILVFPAIAYLCLKKRRESWNLHILTSAGLFFVLGFSVYIYLPVRSGQNPPINYGHPDNLTNFIHVVARRDYGTFQLAANSKTMSHKTTLSRLETTRKYLFATINTNYSRWGLFCCLTGCIWLLLKKPLYGFFFLLYFGIPFIVLSNLSDVPTSQDDAFAKAIFNRITYLWYPAICVWIVAGCCGISQTCANLLPISRTFFARYYYVLIIPSIFVSVSPIMTKYNYRESYEAYDYGKNVLSSLPANSFLLFPGDIAYFATLYLQYVENFRPDVKIIPQFLMEAAWARPLVSDKWPEVAPKNANQSTSLYTEAFIRNAAQLYPVFLNSRSGFLYTLNLPKFELQPFGMFQLVNGKPLSKISQQTLLKSLTIRDFNKHAREENPFLQEIFLYYAGMYLDLGDSYSKQNKPLDAISLYLKAWSLYPYLYETAYRLGGGYYTIGQWKPAEYWFKNALELKPAFGFGYYYLARVYLQMGQKSESITLLKTAINLEPTNQTFIEQLRLLQTP